MNNARSELSGVRVAITNCQDGLALLGAADSKMSEMADKLIAMRDVALRAANDATLSAADITALEKEFDSLRSDLDSYYTATLNGVYLFKTGTRGLGTTATASQVRIQCGPGTGDKFTVGMNKGMAGSATWDTKTIASAAATWTTPTKALSAVTDVDEFEALRVAQHALLGSNMRAVETKLGDLQNSEVSLSSTVSAVGDADLAAELANLTRDQILSQAATAIMAQANLQASSMIGLMA
jgi:flagellin